MVAKRGLVRAWGQRRTREEGVAAHRGACLLALLPIIASAPPIRQTHRRHRLDDPPYSPQPARDLACDRPHGRAHPPQRGVDDFQDRERLGPFGRLAEAVEVVPATQVVCEGRDGRPRLLARGRLAEDGAVRARGAGREDEPEGQEEEAGPEEGGEGVEREEVGFEDWRGAWASARAANEAWGWSQRGRGTGSVGSTRPGRRRPRKEREEGEGGDAERENN